MAKSGFEPRSDSISLGLNYHAIQRNEALLMVIVLGTYSHLRFSPLSPPPSLLFFLPPSFPPFLLFFLPSIHLCIPIITDSASSHLHVVCTIPGTVLGAGDTEDHKMKFRASRFRQMDGTDTKL